MILRIFLDEFCKLRRERCGHRDRRNLAKIAKKILKSRVYKIFSHKFKQFLNVLYKTLSLLQDPQECQSLLSAHRLIQS